MVIKQILPKLTKSYIFENLNQVSIYATYLDLSEELIERCTNDHSYHIRSPLRTDIHPSVGFKYNNKGKLKMKDFAGYFHGDIFDLVAYIIKVDVSTKQGFYTVLEHIAVTMRMFSAKSISNYKVIDLDEVRSRRKVFEIDIRQWNISDERYWYNRNIPIPQLTKYRVYPISQLYIDRTLNPNPVYYYTHEDPAYAYYLGKDDEGIMLFEIYFPLRDKHVSNKFITNGQVLKGTEYLVKDNHILITKSYKDLMSLDNTFNALHLPISTISLASENHIISLKQFNQLSAIGASITTLFDSDRAGMKLAAEYRRRYGIQPMLINSNTIGIPSGIKDYTELYLNISESKINNLILTQYETFNNFT